MKRSLPYLPAAAAFALFTPALLHAQGASGEGSAADVAGSAVAAVAKRTEPVSVFSLIEAGGWAMIPLVLMSVIAVALVIFFIFTLRRSAVVTSHYMHTAEGLLRKGDFPALLSISQRHSEATARVTRRMLEFIVENPGASFEIVREIAQTEGAGIVAGFQSRISYLADIAVLAPMVGLLGTVFGIIRSFGVMASGESEAGRNVLLAAGVSEALVATGAGLVVGIVAMAFYGLFRNRVQGMISDMERATAQVLALMALHFGGRDEARSSRERAGTPAGGIRREPPARRPVSLDDEF